MRTEGRGTERLAEAQKRIAQEAEISAMGRGTKRRARTEDKGTEGRAETQSGERIRQREARRAESKSGD